MSANGWRLLRCKQTHHVVPYPLGYGKKAKIFELSLTRQVSFLLLIWRFLHWLQYFPVPCVILQIVLNLVFCQYACLCQVFAEMVTNTSVIVKHIAGTTISSTLFVESAPAIIVHIFWHQFPIILFAVRLLVIMVTGSSLIWREGLSWSEVNFELSGYDKALVEASERGTLSRGTGTYTGEFCNICVCVCVRVCACVRVVSVVSQHSQVDGPSAY